MKQTKIITSINFGCFPGYCVFAAGHTMAELRAHFKKEEKQNKIDKGWRMCLEDEEFGDRKFLAMHRSLVSPKGDVSHYYYVLFIEPFMWRDASYVILAHEFLHICQFYLPPVLDRNREIEAEAYLHSHLMQQVLDKMRS